jgi:citrate lyase subunit beta/citryl-CoA lyase
MTGTQKLRRSFFYVAPAYQASLASARTARADIICLDLEDSTPPAAKPGARETIAAFLAAGRPAALEILVRVNALDTSWGFEDLRFAAELGVDGVLLPKVEGDDMIRQAQHVLAEATAQPPKLWCLVETPLGVLRAEQIAAAGIAGIVVGGADLMEGLGASNIQTRLPIWHALSQVILVARAFGVAAIDAMHLPFDDVEGLEQSCRQAVELGFDGKSVYSAADAAFVNRIFSPAAEDVARARNAVGGIGYGGHLAHARRVLAFHELVTARDKN